MSDTDQPADDRSRPRDVVIIGAGPAGLAVAGALAAQGVRSILLEKAPALGASWRRHYDRLHLHTTRRWSSLPGLPIPRSAGRWVAREDVVAYLEDYAEHFDLDVRTGVEVTEIRHGEKRWRLLTSDGSSIDADDVVVATGHNHTPLAPGWPGRDSYTGTLVHAADYSNAAPYAGKDVLVVGTGNTGCEIAVDLADGGASRVRLAVRTPPHILRRTRFGIPAQANAILVRHLPTRLVDKLAGPIERSQVPDLSEHGMPRPDTGLYSRVRQGAIPVQDVGVVDAIRAGRVECVAAVESIDGYDVRLADGTTISPDTVIVAAGYRAALGGLVGRLGLLDRAGRPIVHGQLTDPFAPNLYFIGFTNPISGMLREIRIDAVKIARRIAAVGERWSASVTEG